MVTLFWAVLAVLYLALAIVTWVLSRPVLDQLARLRKLGDIIVINPPLEKRDEAGKLEIEKTLHRAFKGIIITDTVGFVLAAIAAFISAFIL
jgi:hypothetical protein